MLQFCSTRWVEDVIVAERAVEIWPNVVKYVNETLKKPKKCIPTVASFTTVHEYTKDPLVIAKLPSFHINRPDSATFFKEVPNR